MPKEEKQEMVFIADGKIFHVWPLLKFLKNNPISDRFWPEIRKTNTNEQSLEIKKTICQKEWWGGRGGAENLQIVCTQESEVTKKISK